MKVVFLALLLVALVTQCKGIFPVTKLPIPSFCKNDRDCPSSKICKSIGFLKLKTCVKKLVTTTKTTTTTTPTTPTPQVNCSPLTKTSGVKGFWCPKGTKHNSICFVRCSSGYCSVGISSTTCKCSKGVCKWDRGNPKCKPNTNKCEKDLDCGNTHRCANGPCGKICLKNPPVLTCKSEVYTSNPNQCALQQVCSGSWQCPKLQTCCKSTACNKNVCMIDSPILTPSCPLEGPNVPHSPTYCSLQTACKTSLECGIKGACCFSSVCKKYVCKSNYPITTPTCPAEIPLYPIPPTYCSLQTSCQPPLGCKINEACCFSPICKKHICRAKAPTLPTTCPADPSIVPDTNAFCSIQRSCITSTQCKLSETCCPSTLCKKSICKIKTSLIPGISKCPLSANLQPCSSSQPTCYSNFECLPTHFCCSSDTCKRSICVPKSSLAPVVPHCPVDEDNLSYCNAKTECHGGFFCKHDESCCESKACKKKICV